MFDPEGLEDALVTELTARLPSGWAARASDRREETPGSAIVRFTDVVFANQSLREDPQFSRTGTTEAGSQVEVVFNAARGAARGAFSGIADALLKACYNLSQSRREDWTLDRFGEVELPAEAKDAPKVWRATCAVRTKIKAC